MQKGRPDQPLSTLRASEHATPSDLGNIHLDLTGTRKRFVVNGMPTFCLNLSTRICSRRLVKYLA